MKKIMSILLVCAIAFSALSAFTFSGAAEVEKRFIVDGNLDVWYINVDEYPTYIEEHPNFYQMDTLDCRLKNGVTPYNSPTIAANIWTAWDEEYAYIYVKVWDDELVAYDPNDSVKFPHSGYADSIEIWFDPDPNSQGCTYTYDANGKITKETPKDKTAILDGIWANTPDPAQGDTNVRLIPANNFMRHDYAITDQLKPGYSVTYDEYINNPENLCAFTFENEPCTVKDEWGDDHVISSGYGLEVRFPRNNDSSNHYRFHVAVNNSSTSEMDRFALCTGLSWWMRYDTAWQIDYIDGIDNPFFDQPEDQLSYKYIHYTDSEINMRGPGGQLVNRIAELPETVTKDHKDAVRELVDAYDALNEMDRGYVAYKNGADLEAAAQVVGIEFTLATGGGGDIGPSMLYQEIVSRIQGLPEEITLEQAEAVEDITNLLERLSEEEYALLDEATLQKYTSAVETVAYLQQLTTLGDVYVDGEIDAKDALKVLQAAVGKATLYEDEAFSADVNFDDAIDATDALEILQVAVGTREQFSGLEAK